MREDGREAIVMDGGSRGKIVTVCADPNCRVHHPDRPSPQKLERERAEERKRIAQDKLAITMPVSEILVSPNER